MEADLLQIGYELVERAADDHVSAGADNPLVRQVLGDNLLRRLRSAAGRLVAIDGSLPRPSLCVVGLYFDTDEPAFDTAEQIGSPFWREPDSAGSPLVRREHIPRLDFHDVDALTFEPRHDGFFESLLGVHC